MTSPNYINVVLNNDNFYCYHGTTSILLYDYVCVFHYRVKSSKIFCTLPFRLCFEPSNKYLTFGSMETTKSMFLSMLVSFIFIFCCYVSSVKAALSFGFYADSCPNAELMIRNTVSSSSSNDPSVPGKLLRLVFHDCFVEVSRSLVFFSK